MRSATAPRWLLNVLGFRLIDGVFYIFIQCSSGGFDNPLFFCRVSSSFETFESRSDRLITSLRDISNVRNSATHASAVINTKHADKLIFFSVFTRNRCLLTTTLTANLHTRSGVSGWDCVSFFIPALFTRQAAVCAIPLPHAVHGIHDNSRSLSPSLLRIFVLKPFQIVTSFAPKDSCYSSSYTSSFVRCFCNDVF